MFLISEDDLKHVSTLTESSALSKKEKREAERRKKATGRFNTPQLTLRPNTHTHTHKLSNLVQTTRLWPVPDKDLATEAEYNTSPPKKQATF